MCIGRCRRGVGEMERNERKDNKTNVYARVDSPSVRECARFYLFGRGPFLRWSHPVCVFVLYVSFLLGCVCVFLSIFFLFL